MITVEFYPEVRKALNTFLGNTIHDLASQWAMTKGGQTIHVEGTSYEEINGNKSYKVELQEYQTELIIHQDSIEMLDFSLLRNQIYQAARKQAREMNDNFIEKLKAAGQTFDPKEGSAIDAILNLMRTAKKKGLNLDTLQIGGGKELRTKFEKEMENPLNQERYYREWRKIKDETSK